MEYSMSQAKLPANIAIPNNLNGVEVSLMSLLMFDAELSDDESGFTQFENVLHRLKRLINLIWNGCTGMVIPNVLELNAEKSREIEVEMTRRSRNRSGLQNLLQYYRHAFRYEVKFPKLVTVRDLGGIDYPLEVLWVRYRTQPVFPGNVVDPSNASQEAHWRSMHGFNLRLHGRNQQQQPADPLEEEHPIVHHVPFIVPQVLQMPALVPLTRPVVQPAAQPAQQVNEEFKWDE